MHSYLRAVGFSEVRDITQLNMLIDEIVRFHTEKTVFENDDGRILAEISKEYGEGFGLTVCGEYDRNGMFYAEYVFPYMLGRMESSTEPIVIERHVANDSFCGACDDLRVGATIIFYLQNMGEYMKRPKAKRAPELLYSVSFAGLSKDGRILLPVDKTIEDEELKKAEKEREELIQAARDGDADAMDLLSGEDYDTYAMLIERVSKEDVLSIVDTYFMPNGSDCECYSVLGTILDVERRVNKATNQTVIRLGLECNGIAMDVGINEEDLIGEAVPGRRFKGSVWLMGEVTFADY